MIVQYLRSEKLFMAAVVIQDEANMKTAEQQVCVFVCAPHSLVYRHAPEGYRDYVHMYMEISTYGQLFSLKGLRRRRGEKKESGRSC